MVRAPETVGLDLAGSARRTSACRVRWFADRLEVEFIAERDDQDLVRLIVDCAAAGSMVGIDCPLGWPQLFVETLAAHQSGLQLPAGPQPDPAVRSLNPVLYRLTDDVVWKRTGSRPPLSVAANLLGVVALRCARLLDTVQRQHGISIDRSGRSGVVAEVYPAATLRVWELSGLTSYKQPDAREPRSVILGLLEKQLGFALDETVHARCRASHDDLDALIAAFAARAADLRRTVTPDSDSAWQRATVEGWIHLPDCAPADLLP